jgi:hypothetical protein
LNNQKIRKILTEEEVEDTQEVIRINNLKFWEQYQRAKTG